VPNYTEAKEQTPNLEKDDQFVRKTQELSHIKIKRELIGQAREAYAVITVNRRKSALMHLVDTSILTDHLWGKMP
jgi:hypothetical protein